MEDKAASIPAAHLSETLSMHILALLSLSGLVLQAFLMIPRENETQMASDEPSPKLPRLGEVATLPASITFPWCRLSSSFHAEQEEEISTCWTSTSQDPN